MSKRSTRSQSSFDFETLGQYRAALGITGTQDAGDKANKQYINFGIKSDRAAFKQYVSDVKEEFAGVIKLQQAVSKAGGPLEATLDGEIHVLDQAFVSAARLDVEKRLDRIVDITYSSRPNVDLDGKKIIRDGEKKITNGARYYNQAFLDFIDSSLAENYKGITSDVELGYASTSELNSLVTALCKPAKVDGKKFTASKALVTLLNTPTVVEFTNTAPAASQTDDYLQSAIKEDDEIIINVKGSKGTTKRTLYADSELIQAINGMNVLKERARVFNTNLAAQTGAGVAPGTEYPVALGAVVTSLYSYNSSEFEALKNAENPYEKQFESVAEIDNGDAVRALTAAIKDSPAYIKAVANRKAAKALAKEAEKEAAKEVKALAKEEKIAAKEAAKEEKALAKEAVKAAKAKSDRGRSPAAKGKAKAAPKKSRGASKSRSASRGASKPRSRSRGASRSRSPSKSPSRSRSRSRSPSKSPVRSASRGSSRGRASVDCPAPAMSPVSRRARK